MRVLLLSLVALPALADEPAPIYPDRTEIDFEAVDVNASLVRPSISIDIERRFGTFHPMIDLRKNFDPEMTDSLADL